MTSIAAGSTARTIISDETRASADAAFAALRSAAEEANAISDELLARTHLPWCETETCAVGEESVTHYSPRHVVALDGPNTSRNAPGLGELAVRVTTFNGRPMMVDIEVDTTSSGCEDVMWLTPEEGRGYAHAILAAIDEAEGMSTSLNRSSHVVDAGLQIDLTGGTAEDRALIASLTPAELAEVTAAAKETAEAKAAEIRAARARAGHPAWCDPESCDSDMTGGYLRDVLHLGREASHSIGTEFTCTLQLARGDNMDGLSEDRPTNIDVRMDDDPAGVSPDDLESLGAWLVERARGARRAIATEGSAR